MRSVWDRIKSFAFWGLVTWVVLGMVAQMLGLAPSHHVAQVGDPCGPDATLVVVGTPLNSDLSCEPIDGR